MEQMDISDWCYHTHCLSAKWSVTRPWSDVMAQKAKISHTRRHIFIFHLISKVSYISITSVHVIQFHFTEKPQAGGNSHHHLLTRVYSYWSAEDLDCTMEAPQWHIPDSSSSGVQTSTRTSLSVKMPSSASRRPEEPQGFRDCLYMSRMPQKCVFKDLYCCHTKRRIGRWGPCQSFWYDTDNTTYCKTLQPSQIICAILYSQCHTRPSRQSFF